MIDAIGRRRSIRRFRPEAVPRERLAEVLRAAVLAPSAKNGQPWKFIVLGEASRKTALEAMDAGIRSRMAEEALRPALASAVHTLRVMKSAPALVLIVYPAGVNPAGMVEGSARIMEQMDVLSLGAAVENMLLEAVAQGLGSLWIGNTVFAHDEMARALKLEGELIGAVALGYADESPEPRPRKPMDEVVVYLP